MRGRRLISRRIGKIGEYQKTTLEGIIIYIDAIEGWCNVELPNGDILYRIYFSEGTNQRLKRLQQTVTLLQTVGTRYRYVIIGAGSKFINSNIFADKGVTQWDATPTKSKWNAHYQWK